MTTKPGPWDQTGETELEYCRRVAYENEPQRFRLHIKEVGTGTLLVNDVFSWRMIPGAALSIQVDGHPKRFHVRRVVPHPALTKVDVVWVEMECSQSKDPSNPLPKSEDDKGRGPKT